MGQKTNPVGFRTGITENWSSRWFAKGEDYSRQVLEDKKLRNFLQKRLSGAGLHKIEIERSIASLKIILYVSRPGVVIGRGGTGIEELKENLKKMTTDKLEVAVEEIKVPEISARLIADSIARQIERRIHYKRAMVAAAERAMERGAKGVKIIIGGVLGGASSISRKDKIVKGSVPSQTLRAKIEFAREAAQTAYGNIGIKVWVYLGESAGF
ncbi:MAG: 30S ribosomal protein S3 [bacterium]|nr:30S ribosomal protein S3 [bacterium]